MRQEDHTPLTDYAHYLKRVLGWVHLSDIKKSAVTGSDWYWPRAKVAGKKAHKPLEYHPKSNPFNDALIYDVERYLAGHNTRAFLVMHKGKLVHQTYINFQPEQVFNSMSLVKSLLGICVGIAIDRRLIGDVHDLACDYLHEWRNDARRFITIEDLLTMQSGLLSDVSVERHVRPAVVPLYLGNDIRKTALSIPAMGAPQKHFIYNNFNSQLLGIILERASGMTFAEFVSKYVWQPLGCRDAFSWVDERGMARTFASFFACPEDWLRLGQLVADNGMYQGTQIVPSSWLDAMQTPTNTLQRGVKKAHGDYGYHLWLKAHDYGVIAGIPRIEGCYAKSALVDDSMVYFEGMRGQYVYISQKYELVMLRMGERPRRDWDASHVVNKLVRALAAA